MSELFNGANLAPKEQLPGQMPQGAAVQSIRTVPLYTVDAAWPCAACRHRHDEHKFLYGMGIRDRYRCEARLADGSQCDCGKQYMITAMMVDPSEIDTDEKREEFIRRANEAHAKERRRFDV